MAQKIAGSNPSSFDQRLDNSFFQPSRKLDLFSNQGKIRQRRE